MEYKWQAAFVQSGMEMTGPIPICFLNINSVIFFFSPISDWRLHFACQTTRPANICWFHESVGMAGFQFDRIANCFWWRPPLKMNRRFCLNCDGLKRSGQWLIVLAVWNYVIFDRCVWHWVWPAKWIYWFSLCADLNDLLQFQFVQI